MGDLGHCRKDIRPMNKYEVVIGLEIHVQLKTASKMFCSCANVGGEAQPNTAVCPVCMGHPGTLPVINLAAVKQGIRLALALGCNSSPETRFDRKNYFYPDLPKGYQISQFDRPLALGGVVHMHVGGTLKAYRLERLHLEEDAGKNMHVGSNSLVDFNRAGVPLAEIVTKPDFRSPEEAKAFLQELRLIARYCGVSDADMEKGQLRCDANISLRPVGDAKLYPKTEVKNLNSFRSVERALQYEIKRQTALWEQDAAPTKGETRGWNDTKGETVAQRGKEGSDDYRYFPEPDLPPLSITQEEITTLKDSLPELPEEKRKRFVEEYELHYAEASVFVAQKDAADYFEAVVTELKGWLYDTGGEGNGTKEEIWLTNRKRLTKLAFSWITSELFKHIKTDEKDFSEVAITPENMAEFIVLVYEAKVNSSAAQTILERMYHTGKDPHEIAEDEDLFQSSDEGDLGIFIDQAITENPKQVEEYRGGKEPVLQFLVGKVMKLSGGKANPGVVAKILKEKLS